jgi:hypothetical protein
LARQNKEDMRTIAWIALIAAMIFAAVANRIDNRTLEQKTSYSAAFIRTTAANSN